MGYEPAAFRRPLGINAVLLRDGTLRGVVCPGCALSQVISVGALRLLFFLLFIIQMLLPLYHWVRDPYFVADGLSGLLLFGSIVAGALGFFIYNVPLLALNTIVRLAQLCLNS